VLNFWNSKQTPNQYYGKLFEDQKGTGHLFNQHYLHTIFKAPLVQENSTLWTYLSPEAKNEFGLQQ
jgi:hypothetical protein